MRLFGSFVSLVLFFSVEPSLAQVDQSAVQTTAPANSRFEIVQSELAARWTFRLDKRCGNVAQLTSTKNESVAWENMLVLGLPPCIPAGKMRFQIFTSGLAARHTFLIDTETGQSWVLVSSNDLNFWKLFEE